MKRNHLNEVKIQDFATGRLRGYGYGLGVRTLMDQAAAGSNGSEEEFGWSGMAETYTLIDLKTGLSVVYAQQMMPNFEDQVQNRIRNIVYGMLE